MFTVRVADNFHPFDPDEAYELGRFETWAEAVAAARRVVDEALVEHHQPGQTADALYEAYVTFGEDPCISPIPAGEAFYARDYARERCRQIIG